MNRFSIKYTSKSVEKNISVAMFLVLCYRIDSLLYVSFFLLLLLLLQFVVLHCFHVHHHSFTFRRFAGVTCERLFAFHMTMQRCARERVSVLNVVHEDGSKNNNNKCIQWKNLWLRLRLILRSYVTIIWSEAKKKYIQLPIKMGKIDAKSYNWRFIGKLICVCCRRFSHS